MPIQPVGKPILCNPYEEPTEHWVYNMETGQASRMQGRRPASYWYKTERLVSQQLRLAILAEEQREDLPMVNALRQDVKRWRESGYEGATQVTKALLAHWWSKEHEPRLFFCQLEAVETVILLNEIRLSGRRLRFRPAFTEEYLERLLDQPADSALSPLTRLGLKMATGTGKTVVMAMLIAWAFCNRAKVASDVRFPSVVLILCPNLTIKERLQVLRPDSVQSYYSAFNLVPTTMRPMLQQGKVLITNWHQLAPESEHTEGGQSYTVVDKGPESPEALAKRVLGDLAERAPILVLNDEGHHAWRPKPVEVGETLIENVEEIREATVWVNGLDAIQQAVGITCCVDLSATPFYISGSGYVEGSPFPWLVSDFGLVDAIESGLVKIPRLPVRDTTGRPEPRYFALWKEVQRNLQPADYLPGRAHRPKPDSVFREIQPALNMLAAQWKERMEYVEAASNEKDKTPPVLIIVCDNTDLAEVIFRQISGEQVYEVPEEVAEEEGEEESEQATGRRSSKRKVKTKVTYTDGVIFPDLLSNRESVTRTIRIDSRLLAEAESGTATGTRGEEALRLRKVVATVGKKGQPGEHIRCIVAVAMLNEGWDANNVTQILGVRAFTSQLLCEQVVGRGLRRMDYTPDPKTGLLTEEYVDIYGIPFTLIPFKGRAQQAKEPGDRPLNHVMALDDRAGYEVRFPVVEGYAFALHRNLIAADIDQVVRLRIEPEQEPTAVYVTPRVGYQVGTVSMGGPGEARMQTREAYYQSTHLQAIEFELARQLVFLLVGDEQNSPDPRGNPQLRLQSRHQLFPQVLRIVHGYIQRRVDCRGVDPRELGQKKYFDLIVERLLAAIRPDDDQGEPPLMPILNRYKPIATTADVDFKTVRTCYSATKSHINLVPVDSGWEGTAAFGLEQSQDVLYYARNDGLDLTIPYQFLGMNHLYEPDFLVRLRGGLTVIVEIKGMETEQDRAKYQAAERWVSAVNNWSESNGLGMGRWAFHVNHDPQMLGAELGMVAR